MLPDAPETFRGLRYPFGRKINPEPGEPEQIAEGVYWGDTHLHTAYSSDSGMIGNKLGPDEAYAFAKGEQVTSSTGLPAKLGRPPSRTVISPSTIVPGGSPEIPASSG